MEFKVNRHLSKKIKKNEKNEKKKSESVKPLRCMDEFFSRLITSHHVKLASYT